MNLSINLLSDYESLYHVIVKDVLKHKREECSKDALNKKKIDRCSDIYNLKQVDFKSYLTPENQSEVTKQNLYLKKVYKKLDEIENDNNIIDIQHKNIENKEKVIRGYTGIIIFILSMIIIYYLYIIYVNVNVGIKPPTGGENIKGYIAKYNMRSLYCNNINIIAVLIYLAIFANNYQTNEINKLDNEKILDLGRIAISAEMLGNTEEAFEVTVNYLKERKQFGVQIGSFQALQHRAAKMFCEIELTKSAVIAAMHAADENSNELERLSSLAKFQAGETLHLVSNEAIQMHGGIGVTDEYDIGFYLKRARVAEQIFGTSEFHQARYANISGF